MEFGPRIPFSKDLLQSSQPLSFPENLLRWTCLPDIVPLAWIGGLVVAGAAATALTTAESISCHSSFVMATAMVPRLSASLALAS